MFVVHGFGSKLTLVYSVPELSSTHQNSLIPLNILQ